VTRVGVALSGGGHRASVWAAGLLLYLADAGRNGDVGVIASVSGGSITNGVVAQQMDYRQARTDEVRDGLGPLLHHIAYTGLFFWGPSTNRYVITVLGVLGLGLLGFLAGLVMAFITGIGIAAGIVLVASLIVLAAGVVIFARRSTVVDRALARTHFSRHGRPTGLASVARSLDHVFCGDAQIENWEYALTFAPDRQAVLELLRGVDLYKVGHHGSRNATPRTLFNLWNEAATRDRAMVALMSTKMGVFPGTPGSNTEVPRETLVTALGQRMKPLFSTIDLQPGISHVEVAAPAFGDAEFTEVSN
jgi:hypothetical protein